MEDGARSSFGRGAEERVAVSMKDLRKRTILLQVLLEGASGEGHRIPEGPGNHDLTGGFHSKQQRQPNETFGADECGLYISFISGNENREHPLNREQDSLKGGSGGVNDLPRPNGRELGPCEDEPQGGSRQGGEQSIPRYRDRVLQNLHPRASTFQVRIPSFRTDGDHLRSEATQGTLNQTRLVIETKQI